MTVWWYDMYCVCIIMGVVLEMLYVFKTLYFKLLPCSKCCTLSSRLFPGVWILCADVSERSVCSIFIGRCQWRWNGQSVPKRRHTKFGRRGITQKKAYNISLKLFVPYVMNYITCGKIISFNPVKVSAKYTHLCLYLFFAILLNKFMVYSLGMLELFIWSKNIN